MNNRGRGAVGDGPHKPENAITPQMERAMAARSLLAAVDGYVRVLIASHAKPDDEWVDQNTSPLGKFAHLRAVKQGRLPGVKHGKRVLVRRADLNSYLAKHSVKHRADFETTSDDAIDERRAEEVATEVLTHVGLRRRKG